MSPRLILIGLIAASATLAGCGKVGELERPHPMFGAPNDSAPETQARHAAARRARADAAQATPVDDAPQSIEELRNYNSPGMRKSREQPIQAAPGDPDASQPEAAPAKPAPTPPGEDDPAPPQLDPH